MQGSLRDDEDIIVELYAADLPRGARPYVSRPDPAFSSASLYHASDITSDYIPRRQYGEAVARVDM